MPPGGDGYYYFSVYFHAPGNEYIYLNVEINGVLLCSANSDLTESTSTDYETTSCSAVTYAVEGIYGD